MKKLQVLCLCLLLSIGVIGCTGTEEGKDGTEKSAQTESTVVETNAESVSSEPEVSSDLDGETEDDTGIEEINVGDPFAEEQ